MVVLLVIASGLVARHRWWERAEARLRSLFGNSLEVRMTRARGDATVQAREAILTGADWIAAAGGDGTINEVVNGLFHGGKTSVHGPGNRV